ncbi:MAG: hypothetical protein M1365_03070 [Actinobacteria bacterium]|nr:hypothetical protein [Actinomycetota bacterium]
MPKINYNLARNQLSQAFERYLNHNKAQLDTVKRTSPWIPAEHFFMRAGLVFPGFLGWVSCKYAEIMDYIFRLNRYPGGNILIYYEEQYPPCKFKTTFIPAPIIMDTPGFNLNGGDPHVDPKLVLDRLTVLVGLFHYVMVEEKSVRDFEKNLEDYKSKNASDFLYTESDPHSIKIYKTLKELKGIASFINDTLPDYHSKGINYLVNTIQESFPTFEGYIKGVAVRELKSTLDDTLLSDEEAVKAIALQLKNEDVLDILGKNRQSQTEHILKVISVILIAVGIGIVPTAILAAKRLYDSGGTSINFFKPLSQNLCEDAEYLTSDVDLNIKMY